MVLGLGENAVVVISEAPFHDGDVAGIRRGLGAVLSEPHAGGQCEGEGAWG
jgi:hypothetical protein